nr:hypothetical protein [uncultured Pseudomonas sp.]
MKLRARAVFIKAKLRLKLRAKNVLVDLIARHFPGVAATLGARNAQNRDDVAVLAYALAHATDPLTALNYYSNGFNFSNKTLWLVLCNLQENRKPAFDRIMHDATHVSSSELRLQLLIKQVSLQQTMASDVTIGGMVDTYNCIRPHLENQKGVAADLASLLIDKAPIENIESWLQKVELDIGLLTEFQQLKFLFRLSRSQDKLRFESWENRLLPMVTQPAKLKIMLMRFSLVGDDDAFSKLEEAFCNMNFSISEIYRGQIKPIFDQIPKSNNFLNARFSPRLIDALQGLILQRVIDRQSLAYMRLGDGESYGFADNRYIDDIGLVRQELHWWGAGLDEPLRHELQDKFQVALAHADLLGVPSVLRLIKDFSFSKRDEYSRNSLISRLFGVMHGVGPYLESKLVLEDQSNLYLFDTNFISELCRLAKRVYVVSGLKSSLIDRWAPDKSKVECIEIPTHRLLRNGDIGGSMPGIFPHVYRDYITEITARAEPGAVFLFSAGFIGKILIAEAAKKGAVALDIGQFLIPAVTEAA